MIAFSYGVHFKQVKEKKNPLLDKIVREYEAIQLYFIKNGIEKIDSTTFDKLFSLRVQFLQFKNSNTIILEFLQKSVQLDTLDNKELIKLQELIGQTYKIQKQIVDDFLEKQVQLEILSVTFQKDYHAETSQPLTYSTLIALYLQNPDINSFHGLKSLEQSFYYEIYLLYVFAIAENKISCTQKELKNIYNLLRNSFEDYVMFLHYANLYKLPKNVETPLLRNIRIKIAIYELENQKILN
jgi:hypothetical protein